MRTLFLAALVAAIPMVAVAQEDRLAGQWVSDVTGEVITIGTKSGGAMEVAFAKTGVASLVPVEQNGLKMNFSSGLFSSTECVYTVIRPGKTGDRMVWSPKQGSAETCPRGAFSRFGDSNVVTTKVESGRTIGTAQPPQRPAEVSRENNYVRSAEQVAGRWASRDRLELKVEKSIGGWVVWAEQEGQGSFVVGEDGAIQANFSNSGTRCALSGRLYEGNLILQADGRIPSTCPQGTFSRVSR